LFLKPYFSVLERDMALARARRAGGRRRAARRIGAAGGRGDQLYVAACPATALIRVGVGAADFWTV